MNFKPLKGINWRIMVGFVVYASYLTLSYFGSMWSEYWTAWIFQCCITTMSIGFGTVAWIKLARKTSKKVDSVYYYPTREQLLSASAYAHKIMETTGWCYPVDYVPKWKDCDKFAERMSTLTKEWFYINVPKQVGKGLGIAPFGYDKENGDGHTCIEALCESAEGRFYHEVYPSYGELVLTPREARSAQWTNF